MLYSDSQSRLLIQLSLVCVSHNSLFRKITISQMSLDSFKKAIQSSDRYSQLGDKIDRKADSTVIVLALGDVEVDRNLASLVKTKRFVFGFDDEFELNLSVLKLKRDSQQDRLLENVSLGQWVRVYRRAVTDIDEWLNEFKRFFKAIIAAWKLFHWKVLDNYPQPVFDFASRLREYSVIVIVGEDGIGKITLAMRLIAAWTQERQFSKKLDDLTSDGILYNALDLDVNKINKFKHRLMITTTSEDVFCGMEDKLTKKVKVIHLKRIPYLLYSIINDNEFGL